MNLTVTLPGKLNTATKKMTIKSENGRVLCTLPYAPTEVTHDGFSSVYNTDDRPGLPPLVTESGKGSRTMSFTMTLGYVDFQKSVEDTITALQALVGSDQRLIVNYGPLEAGLWYLTGFSVDSTQRNLSNAISRATCDLEFTMATGVAAFTGPVTGGVQPPHVVSTSTSSAPKVSSGTFYTVKKGDTLWGIATNFYKNGAQWTKIADANGIRNPKALQIGTKLRIP